MPLQAQLSSASHTTSVLSTASSSPLVSRQRLLEWRKHRAAQPHTHDTMSSIVRGEPPVDRRKRNWGPAQLKNQVWSQVAVAQRDFDAARAESLLDPSSHVATTDFTTRHNITTSLVREHHARLKEALKYHDDRAAADLMKLQREADAARFLMSSRQKKQRGGDDGGAGDGRSVLQSTPPVLLDASDEMDGGQLMMPTRSTSSELPPLVHRQRLTPKPQAPALSPELREILNRNRRAATPPFVLQTHCEWSTLPPRLRSPTESTPALRRQVDGDCAQVDVDTTLMVEASRAARRHQRQAIQSSSPTLLKSLNASCTSDVTLLATRHSSSVLPRGAKGSKRNDVVVVAASVPSTKQIMATDALVRKPRALGAPSPCDFSYWDTVNAIPHLRCPR